MVMTMVMTMMTMVMSSERNVERKESCQLLFRTERNRHQ